MWNRLQIPPTYSARTSEWNATVSLFPFAVQNTDEANIFPPSDLMWSTLTVGVGQPPIQQLHLENGVFLFWSFRGNTDRKKEQRKGHIKEREKVWELTKTNSVFNQLKCCPLFQAWMTWKHYQMQSKERTRQDRGGGSEVGETEQEQSRKAWEYLFF